MQLAVPPSQDEGILLPGGRWGGGAAVNVTEGQGWGSISMGQKQGRVESQKAQTLGTRSKALISGTSRLVLEEGKQGQLC